MTSRQRPATVTLGDAIADVTAARTSELDRVEHAVVLSLQLDHLAHSLLEHFVDRARRGGATWSTVGRALGISKQAAHERFRTRHQPTGRR